MHNFLLIKMMFISALALNLASIGTFTLCTKNCSVKKVKTVKNVKKNMAKDSVVSLTMAWLTGIVTMAIGLGAAG